MTSGRQTQVEQMSIQFSVNWIVCLLHEFSYVIQHNKRKFYLQPVLMMVMIGKHWNFPQGELTDGGRYSRTKFNSKRHDVDHPSIAENVTSWHRVISVSSSTRTGIASTKVLWTMVPNDKWLHENTNIRTFWICMTDRNRFAEVHFFWRDASVWGLSIQTGGVCNASIFTETALK